MPSVATDRPLRPLALTLVWALTAQYLLGMYVNLFVAFPDAAPPEALWGFAWSQWSVASHIVLGTLIVVGSLALCVRAWRLRMRRALWLSVLSLMSLIAASACGAQFVKTQGEWWSFGMAVSFIVAMALLSYVLTVGSGTQVDKRII